MENNYTTILKKPYIINVIGLIGSGKTYFIDHICNELNNEFINNINLN